MEATSDVMDILELSGKESKRGNILSSGMNKKKKSKKLEIKRPEGMAREVWGLIWKDDMDAPPVVPTESTHGYKATKAKLGSSKVRPWSWMPFQNPARKDGAVFYHWRRKADAGKDYPFAAFNKAAEVMTYTDAEYQQHLSGGGDDWTRAETDDLMELAKRFDLRFVVMHDRWNRDRFPNRSVEDIKERYYNIANTLLKIRAPVGQEPRTRIFDGDHERRRKEQLINLYNRTEEQVDEEQELKAELNKIEARKREREKKTADLQKLITAAETPTDQRKPEKKSHPGPGGYKKKHHLIAKRDSTSLTPDTTGIKFSETKQSGVMLRSQRLKLPNSVGLKKNRAIEQVVEDLGLELNPIPTEEVITNFNELRQDIVLMYELKQALGNCDYELQTLKLRLQTLAPERQIQLPATLNTAEVTTGEPSKQPLERKISESIDLTSGGTPIRKRKAALEQGNILKKIKQKY